MLLVAGVSLQALLLAYVYQPRWKAFLWNLPIPFTLASLSLGDKIDVTNICGMLALFVFTHGVRLLHVKLRVPIVAAIAVSAAGYCLVGRGLASVAPKTAAAFWIGAGAVGVVAAVVLRFTPHRAEQGYRSPLPVWVKLPIIVAIVIALVLVKKQLLGVMTFFPMVGVVAMYEARRCPWALCRQLPVVMLTVLPMIAVVRLCEAQLGWTPLPSLALGWAVFLAVLLPVTRRLWAHARAQEAASCARRPADAACPTSD